jgi:hypothetical protein
MFEMNSCAPQNALSYLAIHLYSRAHCCFAVQLVSINDGVGVFDLIIF